MSFDNVTFTVSPKPLQQTIVTPVATRLCDDGVLFVDFGKAALGTLLLPTAGLTGDVIVVHLGEQLTAAGRLERNPAGAIRYIRIEQGVNPQATTTRVVIPPDPRNTGPGAIKMPADIGEVYPFRYAEIEAADGLDGDAVRQIAVHYPFDDTASSFDSSDPLLNAVWEICKYTIKATTFCGVYVDGDRERIPYEGDAYINQLCHYGVDSEYTLARYTHEYLIQRPTWPTEWQLHSVMIAWADYMYTGETISLEAFYDDLVVKTLIDLARADGLISTQSELRTRALEDRLHLYHPNYIYDHGLRDLVDWPPGSFTEGGQGERDNHEMMPINTVINAFHCHALQLMALIAAVLGRSADQLRFARQADLVEESMNRLLFDETRGVYIDGEGSTHASLHSNMFMLAFDLVPDDRKRSVIDFVKSRGMACSVYGSHYLLEALYRHGEAQYALDLMRATHDRSWWHMIELGSTMTLEAWDWKYKNNLDWNHAWGAAPANMLPRYLLGVRPLEPGFRRVLIQPQPASLSHVAGTVPTPLGPIVVAVDTQADGSRELQMSIPNGVIAQVQLPLRQGGAATCLVNGDAVVGRVVGDYLCFDEIRPGQHRFLYR